MYCNTCSENKVDRKDHVKQCCEQLSSHLEKLNCDQKQCIESCLREAVDNLAGHLHYQFLNPEGPARQEITRENPLFPRCAKRK